jgi:hypothetical protein
METWIIYVIAPIAIALVSWILGKNGRRIDETSKLVALPSGGDHPSDGQSREAGGQGRDQGARVGAQERDNPGSFPLQDAFAQVPRVNQVIRVQRSKGR